MYLALKTNDDEQKRFGWCIPASLGEPTGFESRQTQAFSLIN